MMNISRLLQQRFNTLVPLRHTTKIIRRKKKKYDKTIISSRRYYSNNNNSTTTTNISGNNTTSDAITTFLIGSPIALGIAYFTHWTYENLSKKSLFKIPFFGDMEPIKTNIYFTLACAVPFIKFAPNLEKLKATPSILFRYGIFGTFFICSASGLCGSYYKNSKKIRETCEDKYDALKDYLYGVGCTIPFYALALNNQKGKKLTFINKIGAILFLSVIGIESYYNSKLLIRQNLMKRAIKSNMDKNGGNNDIHLDQDISWLLNHPSRRAHSYRHPEMLNGALISLGIAMCGAGMLGLIFGPGLLMMQSLDNIDQEDALLMISEKEKRMKNIMFPILSTKNIVERKLYLKEKVLKIKKPKTTTTASSSSISSTTTTAATNDGNNNNNNIRIKDDYLDTSAIRGTWMIEESYNNINNDKNIISLMLSKMFFPSRDQVGSMIGIARCPPHSCTGDLLMSLDNGKRAYKAVLMMNDNNNNKEDHEQKAKYIIKPWVQPTGDDTIDNSIFRKFLKYCNPKIHLDANTFIFSNEHRELHFIKYGEYNDSKDEYLVIVDGTSKTNFYILSRKGNLKHNSSTQHIYNDILNELRARGFYTV